MGSSKDQSWVRRRLPMDKRKASYLARSRATHHDPQTTRREARLFSIQTVEFSKRPRMNNTSCRCDRTPYRSPAVPEGEILCHTNSKPSVVSTRMFVTRHR